MPEPVSRPAKRDSGRVADRSPAPVRVLYVCTHNSVRSPMAHALTRRLFGREVGSESAGVYSLAPVDPLAVAAMREVGLDITDHTPHTVADLEASGDDIGGYDVIIALSRAAEEAALAAARHTDAPVEYWSVGDPTQTDGDCQDRRLAAYRVVRDRLTDRLKARFGVAGTG